MGFFGQLTWMKTARFNADCVIMCPTLVHVQKHVKLRLRAVLPPTSLGRLFTVFVVVLFLASWSWLKYKVPKGY